MAVTIHAALSYLEESLFRPTLAHGQLPQALRDRVTSTWRKLQRFKRTGDLVLYLSRFDGTQAPDTRNALRALSLPTFEDIRGAFEVFLGSSAQDVTTLNDFVIGARYSTWDILIFSKVYDPRHGGIFLIPNDPPYEAIFIKATLSGGKYPNSWIDRDRRLKYYFYSIDGRFDPNFKFNRAIVESGSTPIFAFVRNSDEEEFVLAGIFKYVGNHSDSDGAKWFDLEKLDSTSQSLTVTDNEYNSQLRAQVATSLQDASDARKKRLQTAPAVPRKIVTQSTAFVRNADVVAEVLIRAQGHCEDCLSTAPFVRRSDGTPYLEVHHIVQLADGGEDTVQNAKALCPNCHRRRHFG